MIHDREKSLLVLCQLFYPELVSTGQTLTELCEELSGLGWRIEVVCAPPTILHGGQACPRLLHHEGIKVRRVWSTRFPKLSLLGRVVNQITYTLSIILFLLFRSRQRPILVLTNPPFLPFACLFAKLFRPSLRYVLLVFDVYPDTAIHLGLISRKGLLARVWEWFNLQSYKRAAKVIVIGRCMRDIITAKGRAVGLDLAGKLHMIHIWSDNRMIGRASAELPEVFQDKGLEDKFIVLYSGNMGRFHDLETLLEAALSLKDHPEIRFAFIGEGAKKQKVVDFISSHDLKNCLVDTYVPKEQLGALLHSVNVGIASLLEGQEGLSVPSKTIGLLAAALPVICIMSPASEIALLAKESGFGFVLTPGDVDNLVAAILKLHAAPDLCRTMGLAGNRLIEGQLSLENAAEAYSELFNSLT
jgi:glycosyltransferase involved in cell wall biosynthesis